MRPDVYYDFLSGKAALDNFLFSCLPFHCIQNTASGGSHICETRASSVFPESNRSVHQCFPDPDHMVFYPYFIKVAYTLYIWWKQARTRDLPWALHTDEWWLNSNPLWMCLRTVYQTTVEQAENDVIIPQRPFWRMEKPWCCACSLCKLFS